MTNRLIYSGVAPDVQVCPQRLSADSRVDKTSTAGNLRVRIQQHNAGGVKATKNRIPIKLVYFEGCASKKQAERRERYFKTGFGRRFLKARIFGK